MFLKSLEVKNFGCFDQLRLDFRTEEETVRKWTVLAGPNGAGKTLLLKAIGLVTAGSDALADLLGAEPSDWIKNGRKSCEIAAVLETKAGEERPVRLTIDRGQSRSEIVVANNASLKPLDEALQHAGRSYFVAGYGASRRLNTAEGLPGARSRNRSFRTLRVASLFDRNATLSPLESWAMDLDYRKPGSGLRTVRTALQSFLRGVKFVGIDKERRQLLFRTPDGVVTLRQLSDGYQNVASWVGDLLFHVSQAFEDYKSPLKARGVLLIDEVDLHLHPQWQRELLSFLTAKLPNFQLIVTTHSPMTAQQCGPGELYAMKREGSRVAMFPFKGDPRRLLVHQMLMSDVFGVESDESLEIETVKDELRRLKTKKPKGAEDRQRMVELVSTVERLPTVSRTDMLRDDSAFAELKKLYQDLKTKTS